MKTFLASLLLAGLLTAQEPQAAPPIDETQSVAYIKAHEKPAEKPAELTTEKKLALRDIEARALRIQVEIYSLTEKRNQLQDRLQLLVKQWTPSGYRLTEDLVFELAPSAPQKP